MARYSPFQISLKSIFILVAISALGMLLLKSLSFQFERFVVVIAITMAALYFLWQGLLLFFAMHELLARFHAYWNRPRNQSERDQPTNPDK